MSGRKKRRGSWPSSLVSLTRASGLWGNAQRGIWHWAGLIGYARILPVLFLFSFPLSPLFPVREFATEGTGQRSGRMSSSSM